MHFMYIVQCSVSENNQMQKINWHTLHYNALQRIFEEEKKVYVSELQCIAMISSMSEGIMQRSDAFCSVV